MNIASFRAFEDLLYKAWQERSLFLAQTLFLPRGFPGVTEQATTGSSKSSQSLVNVAKYYQEIQNQGFYPCVIDRNQKFETEQWEILAAWIKEQSNPLVCVFTGPISADSHVIDCVDYFIPQGNIQAPHASAPKRAAKEILRDTLVKALRSEIRFQPVSSMEFIDQLLNQITETYHIHNCMEATQKVLAKVIDGMEGTLPDKTMLERQVKWAVFEYLAALKGRI